MTLFQNLDGVTIAQCREDAECDPCPACDNGDPCAEPHAAPYDREAEGDRIRAMRQPR